MDGQDTFLSVMNKVIFLKNVMLWNWVKEICALPSTKIFHNAMYDVCWLRSYGVKINGPIIDTWLWHL